MHVVVQIAELLEFVLESQKWFTTSKTKSLLAAASMEHYHTSRTFSNPAETRFGGKLLQFKRFFKMKAAMQSVVQSASYLRFQFADDVITPRISADDVWQVLQTVIDTCSPLMLLLRLADSNKPTLSKVKGTLDYVKTKMVDTGNDTLPDKIAAVFHERLGGFESDVTNAAYILDPQFINKSKNASPEVMQSFWTVARQCLCIYDDAAWRVTRRDIVNELAAFKMKTGAFALEEYATDNACAFWVNAGCHAPVLRHLALRLCALPSSSSEAERNWQEVKSNRTKVRNRISDEVLEKIVFVRRFLRLKRAMCFSSPADPVYQQWMQQLLKQVAADGADDGDDDDDGLGPQEDPTDTNARAVFQDRIEVGEQGKINDREPDQPRVTLSALKKSNAAKSWLFEKYFGMHFVDNNPEGTAESDPLPDPNDWEHRVITNIVWWRNNGWSVLTKLRGVNVEDQSIERYLITDVLHVMIRESPHNTHVMASVLNNAAVAGAAAAASATVPDQDDVDDQQDWVEEI